MKLLKQLLCVAVLAAASISASEQAMEPAQEKAKNTVQVIVTDANDFARAQQIINRLAAVKLHTQLVENEATKFFYLVECAKSWDEAGMCYDFDPVFKLSTKKIEKDDKKKD